MCTYYYLHYHHLAPCTRGIEYAMHYSFCPNSTPGTSSSSYPSPINTQNVGNGERWAQHPCEALSYAPELNSVGGPGYNNSCCSGNCLISQRCSTGSCRLEDLGGCWICCRCSRGGNTLRWCIRPMKKIPDALCSHPICQNCRPDRG
ncbi:hypothetical protein F5Y11DRAFT_114524 [Daldinia sp. FL1419]|nr:hypothetical protein F5Y11DRAFT_114524 [Daldinia sp. FL1419]